MSKQQRYQATPYYGVFTGTAHVLESLSDYLDVMHDEQIGKALREAIKDNVRNLCNAVNALMDDIENLAAMVQYSRCANKLEQLADDAMVLISQHEGA